MNKIHINETTPKRRIKDLEEATTTLSVFSEVIVSVKIMLKPPTADRANTRENRKHSIRLSHENPVCQTPDKVSPRSINTQQIPKPKLIPTPKPDQTRTPNKYMSAKPYKRIAPKTMKNHEKQKKKNIS
jgi:hypothetical protein